MREEGEKAYNEKVNDKGEDANETNNSIAYEMDEPQCKDHGEVMVRFAEKGEQDPKSASAPESKSDDGKLVSNSTQVLPVPPPTSLCHDSTSSSYQSTGEMGFTNNAGFDSLLDVTPKDQSPYDEGLSWTTSFPR